MEGRTSPDPSPTTVDPRRRDRVAHDLEGRRQPSPEVGGRTGRDGGTESKVGGTETWESPRAKGLPLKEWGEAPGTLGRTHRGTQGQGGRVRKETDVPGTAQGRSPGNAHGREDGSCGERSVAVVREGLK